MTSLVASCRSDTAKIDAFVASATVMLENHALPKNAKELAEMSATQQALQQQMPEVSLPTLPTVHPSNRMIFVKN